MKNKIVFFNTGWMDQYRGLTNDKITGGGKYVSDMGWGHELFNFKNYKGKYYGYVQPKSMINLEKLGAKEGADFVKGINVVWLATDPINGGTYIVGWYKNATIFRFSQKPPLNSNRRYKGESINYYAKAKAVDCKLLSVDERNFKVQRGKRNWLGQSNVWYASENPKFIDKVKAYISQGKISKKTKQLKKPKNKGWQTDVLKRNEIEQKAVLVVTKYYHNLGYNVKSFEKDNVGWDLTATNEKVELKLEVKGLSGSQIGTELTPNEYSKMKLHYKYYRICIVTNALAKPTLTIFSYSEDNRQWVSSNGELLQFKKVVGARLFI